jgi:two-component SAPR family response regulator
MPARIVIVHDDAALTLPLLERFAPDAVAFQNPVTALTMLQHIRTVEVLVCRLQFTNQQPIGVSLARLIRRVRPALRVVFTGDPHYREHVQDLGEFVPEPVTSAYVAMMVEWLSQDNAPMVTSN